jgi:hypothetical protein
MHKGKTAVVRASSTSLVLISYCLGFNTIVSLFVGCCVFTDEHKDQGQGRSGSACPHQIYLVRDIRPAVRHVRAPADILVDLDSDKEQAPQPSSRVAARRTLHEEAAKRSTEAAMAVKSEKGTVSTLDSTPSPCLSSLTNSIGINTNNVLEFKP